MVLLLCSFYFVYILNFSKQKIGRERKNKEQTRNRANNCSENNHNFSWNKNPKQKHPACSAAVSQSIIQLVFIVGYRHLEPPQAVKAKQKWTLGFLSSSCC